MPRRSPCAPDSHTGHVPIRFHGSPIQPPGSKNPGIGFDETSDRLRKSPTNPTPTDTLNLRYISANQAPTSSSKYYIPAKGGGWHLLRSRLHGHAHIIMPSRARAHSRPWLYLHGYAHTFTGMCTPSRARACTRTIVTLSRAHLHGHGNIRARLRRDQRPACANQAPIQLTQIPTSNDWGAWASGYGVTSRCDGVGVAATTVGQHLHV